MSQTLRWKVAQAFEIRWWRQYLKGKSKADYLAWKRQYWLDFLAKCHIQVPTSASVMDAGCGPAGIFMVFEQQPKVVALDPLLDRYESDLQHFSRADYPTVQFAHQQLEDWDATQQFDYVFCLNAINHVADLDRCMDLLCDTAASNLIVSIDAHNYPLFKKLFRLAPSDILHPHQYDLAEYQAMLTARGFDITETICMKKEFFFDYYVLVTSKRKV
jgi:2-polyprenyl-6-hydroxyphenyl methylase/3-demethylubiquinone-9 3-methyltransferase